MARIAQPSPAQTQSDEIGSKSYQFVVREKKENTLVPMNGVFVEILRKDGDRSKIDSCELAPIVIRPKLGSNDGVSVCQIGQWITVVPSDHGDDTSYMISTRQSSASTVVATSPLNDGHGVVSYRVKNAKSVIHINDAYDSQFKHTVFVSRHSECGLTDKNGKCTIPVHLKLAELKVIINADLNGVRVFSFSPTSLETERELDITFEVDERNTERTMKG